MNASFREFHDWLRSTLHILFMALLYETVLAFEGTWIECLGDLGIYRMADVDDVRDCEVWTNGTVLVQ